MANKLKGNIGHSVMRSTVVVSICTAVSRLLGLVREILMAVVFGTTLAKSAFDVAFTIPNLFRRLFGEGALSSAFIPVFTEALEKDSKEEARKLAGRIATMLATILTLIVVSGVIFAWVGLRYFSMGEKLTSVMDLLLIMFPYMIFICMVALSMAILNSMHHFFIPAITPVLLNVVWICFLVFISKRFGVEPRERIRGVAVGVLVAGVIQLAVQVPMLMKYRLLPSMSFSWRDRKVRRILTLMAPAALGMGVVQINVCVDKMLALWAAEWGPSALVYAERLIYLPLGIFATALGTVLLPTFSRQATRSEFDRIGPTFAMSARAMMLVMIPAAVGLAVLAMPIARLLYMWNGGKFDNESCLQTTRAIWFYAPGLICFSFYKILVPVYYGMKDTITPVRVGVAVVGLNLVLNIIFVITWPQDYKHAGLAFATVIASAVSGFMLGIILKKRGVNPGWGSLLRSGVRILAAALVMGVVVYFVSGLLTRRFALGNKLGDLIVGGGSILAGLVVYGALATVMCRRETEEVIGQLLRRKSDW